VPGNATTWSGTVGTLLETSYKDILTCMKTVMACIRCCN
jgi:hypothetical protein